MKLQVKTQGISLMELLVTMGLTSVILAGICQVYLYFRHAHDRLEKQMTTAYELQLVTSLLRNSIRRAGFTPCMPLHSLWNEDGLLAYQIKEAGLTLNRMSDPVYLTQVQDNRHVLLDADAMIDHSKTHLMADCYHAELIHINAIRAAKDGQQVELLNALRFSYLPPVYMGEWLSETYYMRYKPYPAFMLKYLHAEVLSPEVVAFHVEEKPHKGMTLLQVTLGLITADEHQLLVRIRSA